MRIPDSMRDCTCFLCVKKNGKIEAGGTAFFILLRSSKHNFLSWTYLVNFAKHCVTNAISQFGAIYARINTVDGSSELVELPKQWYCSEDPAVDIALIPFHPDEAKFKHDSIDVASSVHKGSTEASAIGIGNEVFVIGLFRQHHGKSRNIPIVRHGIVSSMPEEPFVDARSGLSYEASLVEIQSLGGLSGSPVFVHVPVYQLLASSKTASSSRAAMRERFPNGFLYLLGLVRGHFDDVKDIWPSDAISSGKGSVHTGIAVVTPMEEVLKIVIENEELKRQRQQIRRKGR